MGELIPIDKAIQRGLGALAGVIGQPFNVYRLSGSTNIGVRSGSPVLTNYPGNIRRYLKRDAIENTTFELLAYVFNGDRTPLELMDLLVTEGYMSDGGVFSVVQMRPLAETILVSCPFNCTISAIKPTAGAASQQPTSGAVAITSDQGWSGVDKEDEQLLALVDGLYSFKDADDPYWTQPGAAPANVQVALQPKARIRDGNALNVPTEQYRAEYVFWVPDTPGVFLEEVKVRLNIGNAGSDRYELKSYFNTDDVGFSGQYGFCEKLPF